MRKPKPGRSRTPEVEAHAVEETLGRDRISTTSMVRDARGRKLVSREFTGLSRAMRAHLTHVFETQKGIRIRGLLSPHSLVAVEDRLAWMYRPAAGLALSRSEFAVEEAALFLYRTGLLIAQLHARAIFGIELRVERLAVTVDFHPILTGLIASPTLWDTTSSVNALQLGAIDSSVDWIAFAAIMTAVVDRTRTRAPGDERGREELAESARALMVATERPPSADVMRTLGRIATVRAATAVVAGLGVPRLIGRDPLLRELRALIDRRLGPEELVAGPSLVALGGRAGAGKTRILAALAGLLLTDGRRVLVTRSQRNDRRLLGPLQDLLDEAMGRAQPAASAGLQDFGLSHAASRRRQIEASASELLRALSDQPSILIVEDVDLLSDAALEALSFLCRDLCLETHGGVFLVVSLRPAEGDGPDSAAAQLIDELREEGFAERVRLPTLDADSVRSMLDAMGAGSDGAAERLLARTGGNPRHVEALVHLEHEHRREKHALGLGDVLRRRMRRSSEFERPVLEAMAVLDRPATLPLLSRLVPTRLRRGLYATVLRLVERRLLTPVGGATFSFSDRDAAAVILGLIPATRLRQLHRAAGRAIEEFDAATDAADLARHYELGGVRESFLLHGRRAALDLESLHANAEALSLYRRLLVVSPRKEAALRAELLERCGALAVLVGDLDGAIESYRTLVQSGEGGRPTWILWKALGRAYRDKEDHVSAAECFDRGLSAIGEGDDLAVADLLSEKAIMLARFGDHDTARGLADMAGALAERLPESRDMAEIQNRIGATFRLLGDDELWFWNVEASLRVAERVQALDLAGQALNNLGLYLSVHGDRLRAIEHLLRSLEISERLGDVQSISTRSANLGALYLRNCDLDTAESFLEKGLRIARRFGRSFVVTSCLSNLAELNFQRARYGEALEGRLRVLKMDERLGRTQDYANQLVALSRDYLGLGNAQLAERTARQLLEIANRRDEPRIGAQAHCGLAGALALEGDLVGADRFFASAEAVLRDIAAEEELVQCLLERADVYLRWDRRTDAIRAGEEAVAIAANRGYHGDRALGLLLLAEAWLSRDVVVAERQVREAEGIAREVDQPELRWRSEYLAGELALGRGDRAGAARRFTAGKEILESIVGNIRDPELSYGYMRNRRRVRLLRRARETESDEN